MSWQNLPDELKILNQWVGANENKIPLDPKTGKTASVDDPGTWGTFDQACSCGSPHIGFVFTADDPYVFVDLDTGKNTELTKLHAEIVESADSYTETSKSGTGSHIVVRGKMEHGLRADAQGIEIYPNGRYMLATGWQYYGHDIADGQELIDYLSSQINQSRFEVGELVSEESTVSDEDLYNQICQAENGDKFIALWEGTWMNYPEYQDDHSRADLALATFLDFYTKDVDQAVRMFKYSKLYRVEKGRRGGDGTDYIVRTIKQARARNEADIPPMVDAEVLAERVNQVMGADKAIKENNQAQDTQTLPLQPEPQKESGTGDTHNVPKMEITFPPGLVGEIANYIYTSAIRPVPEVALMGALTLVAGLAGRQFNLSGSGINLYLILLAPTGSGKEGAGSGISSLITKVRETVPSVDQFVGPADFASGPALIKSLAEQPCIFSVLGEFGIRLQTMADSRSSGADKTLMRALLNLYSKSGWHQTESSTAYSDREKNTKVLYAPALTILGESTPETFFNGLSEQQVVSGLLPRFMFLEYKGVRPPRNKVSAFCDPDPGLVQKVADLAATVIQMQANASCAPIIVDSQAQAVLDEFDGYCDAKINQSSEVFKQLWNRAHLKALRLGGVIAVGINSVSPVVTADCARWAVEFVKHDMATIETRFLTNEVGEGEHRFEAIIRKVIKEYLQMDNNARLNYSVPKKIVNEPVIPYTFLRRRLRAHSAFKNDKKGVTWAIQSAIKDICEAGVLQQVPPLERKQKYSINSDIYVIGESW